MNEVGVASSRVMYVPIFMKIGHLVQKLEGGCTSWSHKPTSLSLERKVA